MDTNDLYIISFHDPATVSYCSFAKEYIGTIADVEKIIKNLQAANDKSYADTLKAWKKYTAGNKNATHYIAYSNQKLLNKIEKENIIMQVRFSIKPHNKNEKVHWNHINIWDCIYKMQCDEIDITRTIIKIDGIYKTILNAKFINLKYGITDDDNDEVNTEAFVCIAPENKRIKWEPIKKGMFWGNEFVFGLDETKEEAGEETRECSKYIIENILGITENVFSSKKELQEFIASQYSEIANADNKIYHLNLTGIIAEIFADG